MNGICFIEPLFHAVVNGSKTQTRRIMKPQPYLIEHGVPMDDWLNVINPRYKVGEVLYLKEPYTNEVDGHIGVAYKYRPSNTDGISESEIKWKNKLFMPEKYARYFIKITAVRCERLQDISDEDCLKEGIFLNLIEMGFHHYHDIEDRYYCADCEKKGRDRLIEQALKNKELFGFDSENIDDEWICEELDGYTPSCDDEVKVCDICEKVLSAYSNGVDGNNYIEPQEAFAKLIDKISGKGTWQSNPYAWVYDFELIKK